MTNGNNTNKSQTVLLQAGVT